MPEYDPIHLRWNPPYPPTPAERYRLAEEEGRRNYEILRQDQEVESVQDEVERILRGKP